MQSIKVITLLFMAVNTWMDCRKKQISLVLTGGYGLAGIAVSVLQGREWMDLLIPVGTAGFLLGLSVLTKGEIGMGDGWMLLALGMMLSTEHFLGMVCIGMLLAAVCSGLLLAVFQKSRKTEIPLMPFLLAGYIGGMFF